jgi:hypothetical protein
MAAKKKKKKAASKKKTKKATTKKAASKKKTKKKAAASATTKKAVATTKATTKATTSAAVVEKAGDFPEALKHLEEVVNGGQAGEMDFEMYQSFNEQYKPSDWTRNPKTDDELWSFGMDGTGGQVALWRHEPNVKLEDRPVVMLGSEGEVSAIASDLPSFLYLVANGMGPYEVAFDMLTGDEEANDEMLEWINEQWPKRKFPDAKKIIKEAKSKFKHFEKHLRAQCPAD